MAKKKPVTNITDPRYLKALAHPVRIRILALLGEEVLSPVMLASKLDAKIGVVAYHVRTLENLGLIELVKTRPRRGATEHFYQARERPRFSDETWAQLGPVAKQRMLSATLGQIGEYVNGSAAAGGFDRADAHFSRTPMKLDDKGFAQLAAAAQKWLVEAERIENAARKRLEKSDDDDVVIDVGLVLLLFEALPFGRQLPSGTGGRRKKAGSSGAPRPARSTKSR